MSTKLFISDVSIVFKKSRAVPWDVRGSQTSHPFFRQNIIVNALNKIV